MRETAVGPVEAAGINDDTAQRIAMPADAFRGGVHDDIGTEFDRTQQVRGRNGVVDDQRDAVPVRQVGKRLQVSDLSRWVGDGFGEDGPCVRPNL
jgi:hypothetical protein